MTPAAPRGWYRCPNVDCLHFWWGAQAGQIEKRPVRCRRCDTPVRFYPQRTEHNLGEGEDMSERGHGFGWALKQMMDGKRVTRPGWNGKGMYVYDTPAQHDRGEGYAKVDGYFTMRTAQGTLQPGWLISQADARALDWILYEEQPRTETLPIDDAGRTVRRPYGEPEPWTVETLGHHTANVYLGDADPEGAQWGTMLRDPMTGAWYASDAVHRALAAQTGAPFATKGTLDAAATAQAAAWAERNAPAQPDPRQHSAGGVPHATDGERMLPGNGARPQFRVGDRGYYTEIEPHPLLEVMSVMPDGRLHAYRCTSPTGAGVTTDRFLIKPEHLIPEGSG